MEVTGVLESIKQLEVPSGVSGKGSKAHLIDLFPNLCDLITSREPDIKELLKEVFLELSTTFNS